MNGNIFTIWYRPYLSLGGKTPVDICHELSSQKSFWGEIELNYDITKEPIREQNFVIDQVLKKLK
ncbi:MAG: hypothetical protein HRT36_07800 [Alphaproteobacteria bacterium]|nr:hypothetical protein [Alphaproteobacteria bacterium]